jgi:tripartite-type tricarboxylate transporter receptor subunit TctC
MARMDEVQGGYLMTLPRRQFLHLALSTVAAPMLSRVARAEVYPSRPVRWIVAALPGGTADAIARLMGQWLSERLGQPFIIENRPGAGTNIGTESVVKASPDGHTLLLVSPASAINATLYDKLSFNFLQDIASVAGIVSAPNVMEVHPSVPAKTIPQFIAHARAHPGKISYASFGTGTSVHVAGELFKMMAGVDMVHVPYRGPAAALTDLLSGRVQMLCDNILTSIEHIRVGKLIPLAVTTAKRSRLLPELPTVGDYLPGFEASNFFGVGAPKNTPAEIVDRLNREINAGLADPKLQVRLAEIGDPLPGSADDFRSLLARETEKWGEVIKAAGIKPD